MKISSYCIVEAKTILGLEERVRDLISKGWQPVGGPLVHDRDWSLIQAMIKKEAPKTVYKSCL